MQVAIPRFRLVCALSSFVVMGLTGCQSVTGNTPKSLVRVIDASYNAPAVDVYVGSTMIGANLGSPDITSYAFLTPAALAVKVTPTSKVTAVAQTSGTFLGANNTPSSLPTLEVPIRRRS